MLSYVIIFEGMSKKDRKVYLVLRYHFEDYHRESSQFIEKEPISMFEDGKSYIIERRLLYRSICFPGMKKTQNNNLSHSLCEARTLSLTSSNFSIAYFGTPGRRYSL